MLITHNRNPEPGAHNPELDAMQDWQLTKRLSFCEPKTRAQCYRDAISDLFTKYNPLGGYTRLYISTHDNATLCADCAKLEYLSERNDVLTDIYWEGPPIQCAECNCEIKSSYGNTEQEDQ
jgi:hypothetical protein